MRGHVGIDTNERLARRPIHRTDNHVDREVAADRNRRGPRRKGERRAALLDRDARGGPQVVAAAGGTGR